jgi:OOP family OmpA-OmpF porin
MALEGVSFHYDSHELTSDSHSILDRVAGILRQHPELRLEVAGHTDTQGDPDYNLWLSEQRAITVRDYLVKQGVNTDTLTARGYGPHQPITDNTTRAGLARNRRVELRRLP